MTVTQKIHPCIKCGACCAFFRVSFFFSQRENFEKWKVPLAETISTDFKIYTMSGTEKKHHPKCNLLGGKIGKQVACKIYNNRPSPCRNFAASYSDELSGKKNPRCEEARRAHGLAPLNRKDWLVTSVTSVTSVNEQESII